MIGAAVLRESAAVVLASAAGLAIVTRLAPSLPLGLRVASAWPVGSGLAAAMTVICVVLGVSPLLATTMLALAVAGGILTGARVASGRRAPAVQPRVHTVVLAAIGAVALLAALGHRLAAPFPGWDGAAIWGAKARALVAGTLPVWEPLTAHGQPEYPLAVPGAAAWLALARGGWSDGPLLSVGLLGYVSLVALLSHLFLARTGRAAVVLVAGIAPLAGLLEQIDQGNADLSLAALVAILLVALDRWLADGDRSALALAVLVTGLAAWTKFEGVVLAGIAWTVTCTLVRGDPRRRVAATRAAILALALASPWYLSLLVRQMPVDAMSFPDAERLARLPAILAAMAGEALEWRRWGLLWPATGMALVVALGRVSRAGPHARPIAAATRAALPAATLIGGLSAYAAIYVMAPHPDPRVYMAASLPRILIPLVSAAALLLVAALERSPRLRMEHGEKAVGAEAGAIRAREGVDGAGVGR